MVFRSRSPHLTGRTQRSDATPSTRLGEMLHCSIPSMAVLVQDQYDKHQRPRHAHVLSVQLRQPISSCKRKKKHYQNQCSNIVNSHTRSKFQWNLKQNSYIFIHKNSFENIVCEMSAILSQPQCVNKGLHLTPIFKYRRNSRLKSFKHVNLLDTRLE